MFFTSPTESRPFFRSTKALIALLASATLLFGACTSKDESKDESASTVAKSGTQPPIQPVSFLKDGASGQLGELFVNATVAPENANNNSASYDGSLVITPETGDEITEPITLSYEGNYNLEQNAYSANIDYSELATLAAGSEDGGPAAGFGSSLFEDPLKTVIVDDKAYLQWSFLALAGVPRGSWALIPAEQSEAATKSFNLGTDTPNPVEFLAEIKGATTNIEVVGQDEVRGVTTQQVKARVDLEKLAERVEDDEKEKLEERYGAENLNEIPIDFWIDKDGLIRRYRVVLSDSSENSPISSESISLTFEMFDFGKDIKVEIPSEDDTVDGLDLDIFDESSLLQDVEE